MKTVRHLAEKTKPMLALGMNWLFPPRCDACSEPVAQAHTLCAACWQKIHFISEPMCECCGFPFEYAIGSHGLCAACLAERPGYDTARAVMRYDDHSRRLITSLKYADRQDRVPGYARLMARAGHALLGRAEVLVPVPLHRRRLIARRFNQSALLAEAIGVLADIPVCADGLLRTKHTPPQAGLTRAQRLINVRGAFAPNPVREQAIAGKRALLIDDVMTTGATIHACTKALRKAGATHVDVLTLARTVKGEA